MAKEKTFEQALTEANVVIEKLEKGDLSLEAAMKEYKKGFALLADCQGMLQQAEIDFAKLLADHQVTETE